MRLFLFRVEINKGRGLKRAGRGAGERRRDILHGGVVLIDKAVPKSVFEYNFDGIPVLYRDMIHNHIDEILQDEGVNGRGKV